MKIIRIILYLALFAYPFELITQTIQSVYDELLAKYGKMESVSLDFSMREKTGFKGSLKAKSGNKFILRLPYRTVYCNGKTVWNYSPKDKKVIISDYDAENEQSISLERFFFRFIKDFEPVSLAKENNSKAGISHVLSMKPKTTASIDETIEEIKIWLDIKKYTIRAFQVVTAGDIITWDVINLKINGKIANSEFEFKAPDGVEVIDMR
jgi:outer membrane lipoprotein-sorting protein